MDLPIDEAIKNLPNLYEYKRQLQERIKGLQEEVGCKLRIHLDPNPNKIKRSTLKLSEAGFLTTNEWSVRKPS